MENSLIKDIMHVLSSYQTPVLIVENNDGFLFRDDVINKLEENNITTSIGNSLAQRVSFELKDPDKTLLLINKENRIYKEDIERIGYRLDFFLSQFLPGYHIPSVKKLSLDLLNKLYAHKQIFSLSKKETLEEIGKISNDEKINKNKIDLEQFQLSIENYLAAEKIDWLILAKLFGKAISKSIGSKQFEFILNELKLVNLKFQEHLEKDYKHIKNSNPIKKPQVVSRILDFIDFNFKQDRIALIVVDGMSFWQYALIANRLPGKMKEGITYSWIPSITQLSRQAIFKGDSPQVLYNQNPKNESKLWKDYWRSKKINDFEIDYQHGTIDLKNIDSIKRLGIVYKDLDDYMHSSKDYVDLIKLTENWFKRSEIKKTIQLLLDKGFKVFITSDHGNIQAKGWRGLSGKEKLGTNKSGSRSERHIEYSEKWLKDEFINNNPELLDSIVQEDQSIYFKDDLSFSRRDDLVTHGGAHFLEVVIPFIEITNDTSH